MRRIHRLSGILISSFILLHLLNHLTSLLGPDNHISMMLKLRPFYRNSIAEVLLISSVLFQVYSGIIFFKRRRKTAARFFEKLQIWSGLYMAIFFGVHLSAIFFGRLILDLDTNLYFGSAGLNSFPVNLFFIPYYSLAIISFCGHIAAVHRNKSSRKALGVSVLNQSRILI